MKKKPTHILDAKGRMIFEGDILTDAIPSKGLVVYQNNAFIVTTDYEGRDINDTEAYDVLNDDLVENNELVVTGNMHHVDFLQVASGLKEGKVYRHPNFSHDEYLVLNNYDEIKLFDGWREMLPPDFTAEQVLSTEWEEVERQTWYIRSIQRDMHLISDEVYLYYNLSRDDEEFDDSWQCVSLSLEELLAHQKVVTIKISAHAHLSEEEKRKILHLLTSVEQ